MSATPPLLSRSARRLLVLVAVLLPGALLQGCASKEAVSVSGSLGNASMALTQGQLVATVSGRFEMSLELGARASEPTDVSYSAFSLVGASSLAPAFSREHLSVVPSVPSPVHLAPGQSAVVVFQIGNLSANAAVEPMQISRDDFASICSLDALGLVGTIQDSAQGARITSLRSPPFQPSGCE